MNRRLVVPLLVAASACFVPRSVKVDRVERPTQAGDTVTVRSPVKAHLINGSTVLFRDGVRIAQDTAWGVGILYGLTLHDSTRIHALPLDSVVGMESYRTHS